MDSLLLCLITFGGYILMYHLYGKYLGKKIFGINPDNSVPSQTLEDGVDYVPTKKHIIFGHHYTSIAGTGPIVGPAIAVIWGWLPAMLWIFFGSIFMGAVHDFGSLIISMRNEGKSISEITSKYMNSRTRFLFFAVVFFELWIIIAVFALVIAIIFNMFPISVFPVWMEIPIAILLGYLIYKRNANHTFWSIVAIVLMYITVVIGVYLPIKLPGSAILPTTGLWAIILFVYAYIASVLPVTTLLQPRDYINSHELVIAMATLLIGIVFTSFAGGLKLVAPAYQPAPAGAPAIWPLLFITIACGAISGFHSLVSSGTSSKQVMNEKDSLFVGYGSMLFEGALSTLVIIAVAAGIGLGYETGGRTLTGFQAWHTHYASWGAASGLGSKLNAFIIGSANIIANLGIPFKWGVAIMGVFVASFAGTTLDTATRIQRYVVTELAEDVKIKPLKNRYWATFFAVATAALLAFATGANGKGALKLWPLFGSVNQTLAALTLILITIYLKQKSGYKWLISGLPALFMSVMTVWATILNELRFINDNNWLLIVVNSIIIIIVLGIITEGVIKFFKT